MRFRREIRGRPRSAVLVALGSIAFVLASVSPVLAHSRLTSPAPRSTDDDISDPNGPCGAALETDPVVYVPGSLVTVDWEETVEHPGGFEFRFSTANDSGFATVRLVDHIPGTTPSREDPTPYSTTIAFPNVETTDGTLQMIQWLMSTEAESWPPAVPQQGQRHYSCADLNLVWPELTVGDVTFFEGQVSHAESVALTSSIALTEQQIDVDHNATPVSAADTDFSSAPGSATIDAGTTSTNIPVTVHGDKFDESNETFVVVLSDPVNSEIVDGTATVTIQDDDHSRAISLRLRRHLRATGLVTVPDQVGQCRAAVPVRIQRRAAGRWKTLKTVTTKGDGTFSTPVPDKRGSYRATMKEQTKPVGGYDHVCLAGTSALRTHKHG